MDKIIKQEIGEGFTYLGDCKTVIEKELIKTHKGKVDLIFTSPPFPLNRKKKYGNLSGLEYLNWFSDLAPHFSELLSPTGSIVIEMGNSWEPGLPTVSTLNLKTLLAFQEKGNLHLCQNFIWYNTAKLPSPIEWVNKKRIRVKDSFTHIWWLSKSPFPKANNKEVLVEYSNSMKKLLKTKSYNFGKRPSEHNIGEKSFTKDNKGAIPSNVLVSSNTGSSDPYFKKCKENGLEVHPARMPKDLVQFFIKFLTDKEDLVLDPFSGSNTTGAVAQELNRNWISIEVNQDYIESSKYRF